MASSSSSAQPTFTPGLQTPPGVESDPSAPNPFRPYVVLTVTICTAVSGLLLFIRCFVRAFIMRRWGLEDVLCIVSWMLFLGFTAVTIAGLDVGGGQHQWNLSPDQVKESLYYLNNVSQIIYCVSILSIKVTLLYLYRCIFAPARYSRRWWSIMGLMALNILFYTTLTLSKIFLCQPREAIWDKTVKAHCGSSLANLIVSSVWNTASDLAILALPAIFVWKLKLSRHKKVALIATFAIGSIAPIFAVLGIAMRERYTTIPDATWGIEHILLFAYAEVTTGHICASLPVLPRLYRWLRGQEQVGFLARSSRGTWSNDCNNSGNLNGRNNTSDHHHHQYTAGARTARNSRRYLRGSNVQGLQDLDLLATQTYVELAESDNGSNKAHSHQTTGSDPKGSAEVVVHAV